MSKPPLTTPAAAIEYLAKVYAYCEGLNSSVADNWIEDNRGRIVLEHTDRGTVERARKAVALLGSWARSVRIRTLYRYPREGGGWIITVHKRDDTEGRSYTVYQTVFRLPRRVLLAIMIDLDDLPMRAA